MLATDARASSATSRRPAGVSLRVAGTIVTLLVLWGVVAATKSESFLSVQNAKSIVLAWSPLACLAAGLTIVIIAAEMDLSLGSVQSLAAVLAGTAIITHGGSVYLWVPAILAAAGLVPAASSWIAFTLDAPTFAVTLAAVGIVHGGTLFVSQSKSLTGFPSEFRWIGTSSMLGVPTPGVIAVVVVLALQVVMRHTSWGLWLFAVGGDRSAAARLGVSVRGTVILAFAVAGVAAGLAGLLDAARVDSANANLGVSAVLDAIAAIVIGGTSLLGGRGSVLGTAIGALIVASLRNALSLWGVDASWHPVVIGLVTMAAVIVDSLTGRLDLLGTPRGVRS